MRIDSSEKRLNAMIVAIWLTVVVGLIVAGTWFLLIKPVNELNEGSAGETKRAGGAQALISVPALGARAQA